MSFYTTINCMDGRVQLPVNSYLKNRFNVDYVDTITEPGPNRILAEQTNINLLESINNRVKISVEKHGSPGIAVVGHYDCAGNPTAKEEQTGHTIEAVKYLKEMYSGVDVIGLWVDENFEVSEIPID